MTDNIRILVVDDSAYNRRSLRKMLGELPGIEVVGDACDGEEGLRKVFDLKPDLVTLDLAMPRLDGFGFLRIVMEQCPVPVIVISSHSEDENVFRALELGAVEFIPKPSKKITPEIYQVREELLRKVSQASGADMRKVLARPAIDPRRKVRRRQVASPPRKSFGGGGIGHVVIGSSTGGPPALQTIFSAIQESVPVAFAVSQHMPAVFTRAFAERLNRYSALEIREAQSGDIMTPGRVLVAPGGCNLVFDRRREEVCVQVVDPGSAQRYVPSVDVMFSSAGEIFKKDLLGVVLTGMGNDGAQGTIDIKKCGGQVLAEAEESSVVFGMPREAIATGQVDKVVPLPLMCREIFRRCNLASQ